MKKNNNNSIIKTTTLSAQVAITKTECGMNMVQGLPDDPCPGQVEPFHGRGKCQVFNNGAFEFVQEKRLRGKPELKVDYGSLSFCTDGNDRVIFTVPAEMRADMPEILRKVAYDLSDNLRQQKPQAGASCEESRGADGSEKLEAESGESCQSAPR